MDIDSIADELYSLAPQEFVAARNALEQQARAAGDRALATQIRGLSKPNIVAWLSNQLVRAHPETVESFLQLGAGLREATATLSGDQLRSLSGQQRQLVRALVRQAVSLAQAHHRRISSDVARGLEDLLRAALADPDVAEELRSGRMSEGRSPQGFGAMAWSTDAQAQRAARPRSSSKPRTRSETGPELTLVGQDSVARARQRAARRAEIKDALEAARRSLEGAVAAAEAARHELVRAQAGATAADTEVARLRDLLEHAVTRQVASVAGVVQGRTRLHEAERAQSDERDRLTKLEKAYAELDAENA